MAPPLPATFDHCAVFSKKSVIKNKLADVRAIVSGAFRSVQRSGRCVVRELGNGGGDPAPGARAIVVAGGRELVKAGTANLKRLVAIALHHQVGGSPDIAPLRQA
jgi:hypothetical protein